MAVGEVRARRARRLFGAVVLAGLGAAGIMTTVGAEPSPPAPLVEAPGCGRSDAPMPALPPATTDGDRATAPVLVVIPPTTFIWIDDDGAARKVATNTGCAPQPDDRFVAQRGGDPRRGSEASPTLIARVTDQHYGGDWRTLGQWHEL